MESKQNLNNTQRAMLDKIYTAELTDRANVIIKKRSIERPSIVEKALKAFSTTGDNAKLLKKTTEAYTLFQEMKNSLKEQGIYLTSGVDHEPKFGVLSYADDKPPLLKEFDDETVAIQGKLRRAQLEVRARIYGMTTTYEEVRQDLDNYLRELEA